MSKHLVYTLVASLVLAGGIIIVNSNNPASATGVRLDIDQEVSTNPGIFARLRSFLSVRAPSHPTLDPGTIFTVHATAYSSSPYQTDATPCITAAGTRVRQGTVASNFMPLGTILEIDNELYMVEDRMNPRFQRSIDVFFPHTSEALEFGSQQVEVTIVGYGEPGQPLSGIVVQEDGSISEVAATDQRGELTRPSLISRVQGRFYYLRWITSELIGARSPAELNRYDVDCLQEIEEADK